MRHRDVQIGFGLLAAIVTAASISAASAGEGDACCPQTLTRPGFSVFHQPPEPEPIWEKPRFLPPLKLFTVEQTPPRCSQMPPPPAVKYFSLEPPPVRFFTMVPPIPKLLRIEEAPPKVVEASPRPPLRLFTIHPTPPEFVPCLNRPPVKILYQPQPCPAECLGHMGTSR